MGDYEKSRIFAAKSIKKKIMCTVSINVDEAALRDMCPELNTTAAIRLWVQQQIDFRMQEMRAERGRLIDTDAGEAVDLESFRADLHKMIDEIYAEA